MKNPFHELEAVGGKGFWGLVPKDRSKWEKAAWSQEQAEYAAHAINQYEKLVAERDNLWELSTMQDELLACYRIGRNPGGLLDRMKIVRAALLDEEKP